MLDCQFFQRKLCIRTYHVSPLDDKCGIIEWIDNLMPLLVAVEEANSTGGFTKVRMQVDKGFPLPCYNLRHVMQTLHLNRHRFVFGQYSLNCYLL